MEALEKAKLALRAHLLANKAKVAADLYALRKKSEGNDIFNYVNNVSNAFNISGLSFQKEIVYEYSFSPVDYYNLVNVVACVDSPPNGESNIYSNITLKFFQGFSFS